MAQLGSKCLYVLQSKAREGGRERRREESQVLRERIRSDILRASSRNHLPSFSSSDPPRCVELEGELEALVLCTRENCGFAKARTRPTLRIIAPSVCSLITCSVTGGGEESFYDPWKHRLLPSNHLLTRSSEEGIVSLR